MIEKHYRIKDLVELTGFCDKTVRKMFAGEPGVVSIQKKSRGVRRYRSTSVPESVVQRVLRRATVAA